MTELMRYVPNRNYAFMEDHPCGAYVLHSDYEAALAAKDAEILRLTMVAEEERINADQHRVRIAELEEKLVDRTRLWGGALQEVHKLENELSALRASLRAKAEKFERLAGEHEAWSKHYPELTHARKLADAEIAQIRRAAAELRALEGE